MFVNSINVFDCRISEVFIEYRPTEYIARTIRNKGYYKLKKIVGSNNFSAQFIKIISHYKKIGYNINVLQQTACLVVNPITVGNFAFLFNCTPVGRTSDSMMVPT